MHRFGLSTAIFADRFGNCTVRSYEDPSSDMPIERFQVYDESCYMLQGNCLYLCFDNVVPPYKHVQPGASIIFCNCDIDYSEYAQCSCDFLVLENISTNRVINIVASVFEFYNSLCLEIESLPKDDQALSRLVKIGQRMLGVPLCLLDINLDVLAYTDTGYEIFNPLWETVVRDNKPLRCEIMQRYSKQFVLPLKHSDPSPCATQIAFIEGYQTVAHNVYSKNVLTASLWAFQPKPGASFSDAELQLFDWFADCVDRCVAQLGMANQGSGSARERLMVDLAHGVFNDERYAHEACVSVSDSICSKAEHQLLVLKPGLGVPLATCLEINAMIETEVPDALTAVMDYTSVVLLPADPSEYPSSRMLKALDRICRENNYYGVLGTPFKKLLDVPRVLKQVTDTYRFIDISSDGAKLYHYCEFIVQQSMRLIVDAEPVETLIHPWIRKLLAYDRANNTDYLETLKVYLNNLASITEASKELHIHRNTLQHRMNRINEILGTKFEDWQTRRILLYSIDFIHFAERGEI